MMTIGAQLGGLANEGHDRVGVPVHAVAGVARLHRQLDHRRPSDPTRRPGLRDVADALPVELRLPGEERRLTTTQAASRRSARATASSTKLAPERARRARAVHVRDVGAQHERGLVEDRPAPGAAEPRRRELDRVGPGIHERALPLQVFDPREEGTLAEEAVVNGDVGSRPSAAKSRFRRGLAMRDLAGPIRSAHDRVADLGGSIAVSAIPVRRNGAVLGDRRQMVGSSCTKECSQPMMWPWGHQCSRKDGRPRRRARCGNPARVRPASSRAVVQARSAARGRRRSGPSTVDLPGGVLAAETARLRSCRRRRSRTRRPTRRRRRPRALP